MAYCFYTCLHIAAHRNNIGALCWLVQAGADVNCESDNGLTPLHGVSDYHCAILLLAAGAFAVTTPNRVSTAINCAACDRYVSVVTALLAGGADLDVADIHGSTARQILERNNLVVDTELVQSARKHIAEKRLDYVRYRALQVCIGLESLGLPALQTCEILLFACGPVAPLIQFHHWWQIATTIKHFRK
jgi:hypothetical protein